MKPIVLLSGPVGAGKTTVAQRLVEISPAPLAYIEGDKFWFFIAKLKGRELGEKNFKMVMRAMVAAAIPYALNDFETVVDFSIPPWFLETALVMANYRKLPLDYVVLRPSMSTCAERAATREEGRIESYSRYRELYDSFDGSEPHMIMEDEADPAAVAATVRTGLDEGRFRLTQ